jgi:hypothetical protein
VVRPCQVVMVMVCKERVQQDAGVEGRSTSGTAIRILVKGVRGHSGTEPLGKTTRSVGDHSLPRLRTELRHKNIRTTVRYTHVGYEQTRQPGRGA